MAWNGKVTEIFPGDFITELKHTDIGLIDIPYTHLLADYFNDKHKYYIEFTYKGDHYKSTPVDNELMYESYQDKWNIKDLTSYWDLIDNSILTNHLDKYSIYLDIRTSRFIIPINTMKEYNNNYYLFIGQINNIDRINEAINKKEDIHIFF